MSDAPVLVETHNLGVQFGGLKAIDNVNFRLTEGELRCLIGPNGAGKTTFFRLLTGVHQPTRGSVVIGGRSMRGMQTHDIAQLGVGIKIIPSLFENLSVRENVWSSARRHNKKSVADDIVAGVLEDIGLAERSDQESANCRMGSGSGLNSG